MRSIPTPVSPEIDGPGSSGATDPLSCTLRSIAQDIVPARTWTGDRWGPITGELVTVVCRRGEPIISATEWQFAWGWRYNNHHTVAFDGEVFVVTPAGWAGLLGDWSGVHPALALPAGAEEPPLAGVTEPRPLDVTSSGSQYSDRAAQPVAAGVGDVASAPPAPLRGECLLCYLCRMLKEFGCDCRLRFVRHYRDVRAPRATGLERRLAAVGGFCDCEVFLNGYELRPEYSRAGGGEEWSPVLADDDDGDGRVWQVRPCAGVRAGSTQPCAWWRRLRC